MNNPLIISKSNLSCVPNLKSRVPYKLPLSRELTIPSLLTYFTINKWCKKKLKECFFVRSAVYSNEKCFVNKLNVPFLKCSVQANALQMLHTAQVCARAYEF